MVAPPIRSFYAVDSLLQCESEFDPSSGSAAVSLFHPLAPVLGSVDELRTDEIEVDFTMKQVHCLGEEEISKLCQHIKNEESASESNRSECSESSPPVRRGHADDVMKRVSRWGARRGSEGTLWDLDDSDDPDCPTSPWRASSRWCGFAGILRRQNKPAPATRSS